MALAQRDGAGDDRCGEKHDRASERRAQAAVVRALAAKLAVCLGAARLEELALELRQLRRRELEGRAQPRSAVEVGGSVRVGDSIRLLD